MAPKSSTEGSSKRAAHPYHMHEAILRQPELIAQLLDRERTRIERAADAAAARQRLVLTGIGTSYHAAQAGEFFLRHLSAGRIAALVAQSFELVNYPFALGADDALIAVSHRGWKNYSVQAVKAACATGALTIAISGQDAGEGIRGAEFVLPTSEQEVSFAHTKSYTTALAVLALLAIRITERRGLLPNAAAARAALTAVPEQMREAKASESSCRLAARAIAGRERWVFVGAGPNWATACEGALKVKETSYIASEGFETEQFLHGPLAEMDARAALVGLLAGGPSDERMRSLLRAAGELGVLRIVVAARGAGDAPAEHRLEVPAVPEWLSPLILVVPVQLLSYYVAVERGCNPDTGREDQPAHARAREHFKL